MTKSCVLKTFLWLLNLLSYITWSLQKTMRKCKVQRRIHIHLRKDARKFSIWILKELKKKMKCTTLLVVQTLFLKLLNVFFFHSKFYKRVLNKKETELTLRSIFSTSTFNEFYLFAYWFLIAKNWSTQLLLSSTLQA